MKKIILVIGSFLLSNYIYAHDLPLKYSKKITPAQKEILDRTFDEISQLMPKKLKDGLPLNIEVSAEKMSEGQPMPGEEICKKYSDEEAKRKAKLPQSRFVYGMYNRLTNSLYLNVQVLSELAKGRSASSRISCQHGSLYDQSIATIIHELTHAYDAKNKNISASVEFLRNAGFKKGFLRIKSKNINAARSADAYELVNSSEAFAVNMEYFTMDSEYACRKPALFMYYQQLLGVDPFPNRNCELNQTVMLSTSQGFIPVKLDIARIYRVDYLMASPGTDLSSGFGHSMFRIIMCAPDRYDFITKKQIAATPYGPKCLDDKLYHLVVSYRANVQDATLNYVKGIFGGYPSMLFILSFADVLDEYNKDELRDVVSYPLKLSQNEKKEFVARVIEEHWNYRGSYKFFTNNCAVESEDLLKFSIGGTDLAKHSSLTPSGVLEDLDKIQMTEISGKMVENYKAKTDQLISAYKIAYAVKTLNPKKEKEGVLQFIKTSSASQRFLVFQNYLKINKENLDLHAELSKMREDLIRSSSFSVLEQQILRTTGSNFKKRAAELFLNSKDPTIRNLMDNKSSDMKIDFNEMSKRGYGVPLLSEMTSEEEMSAKVQIGKDSSVEFEKVVRNLMPEDFIMIDQIASNISKFNESAINIRKEYRSKLEVYIHQVIHNLTLDETTLKLLIDIQEGDHQKVKELRDLLDSQLVNEREILDSKLIKFVAEELAR